MSLREAKKERTRRDLTAAAIELFAQHGYEATTVDDIAAAVEVSPRTFFRYFASKEDVLDDLMHSGALHLEAELSARPADEPLVRALRSAALSWAAEVEAAPDPVLCLAALSASSPAVRSRLEVLRRESTAQLTSIIRDRLPRLPHTPHTGTDGCAQMVVSLVVAVVTSAIERWAASNGRAKLSQIVEDGFDLLESGIPSTSPAMPTPMMPTPMMPTPMMPTPMTPNA